MKSQTQFNTGNMPCNETNPGGGSVVVYLLFVCCCTHCLWGLSVRSLVLDFSFGLEYLVSFPVSQSSPWEERACCFFLLCSECHVAVIVL